MPPTCASRKSATNGDVLAPSFVRALGTAFDVTLEFDVEAVVTTRTDQGAPGGRLDFLQLRGEYTVTGRAGVLDFDFTAPGAAETFRQAPGR